MKPLDLIATSRRLVGPAARGRPRQTDLRRATSTAYYAVFHALCGMVADSFVGTTKAKRLSRAWTQAYRSLDHHHAKERCETPSVLNRFPDDTRGFALTFVRLQQRRHDADYNPRMRFTRDGVVADIDEAERAIRTLASSPMDVRTAFSVWVCLRGKAPKAG